MDRDPKKEPDQATQMELSGKTAVITGASRGIGRAVALELASAGADVLIHAHRGTGDANSVMLSILAMNRKADVALFDLADPAQQDQLVERAWSWREAIDIWINIAGADVLTGELAKVSFEEKLAWLWQVDVTATIRLARMSGQRMRPRGGVILNMGWDQAEQGMEGDSGQMFSAVKGAVMCFSRSLAQTLAPEVRVNCLAPGWIKTAWGQQASASWQSRAHQQSLLNRWGTAEDVARVARFLVGPAAEFINGQTVNINGGFRYGHQASG